MIHSPLSAMAKTLAVVVALVGAMILGTPRGAEASPLSVPFEIGAPSDVGIAQVQYGHGHWRRHNRHLHRHFHHHRGRHFGHHHGRRFGHHHHGRPGVYHGRTYRY